MARDKIRLIYSGCVAKFSEIRDNMWFLAIKKPMISFKGVHFPKNVILYAVFFYVRYGASYRDLEEILEERGVNVDHATLNRLFSVDRNRSQKMQTYRCDILANG